MIQVRRLGHATFGTPDIERQAEYWCNIMGLVVADKAKGRMILATKSGHEAVALEAGAPGELKRLSFQVAPGSDLGELVGNLSAHGVKCDRAGSSPNAWRRFWPQVQSSWIHERIPTILPSRPCVTLILAALPVQIFTNIQWGMYRFSSKFPSA